MGMKIIAIRMNKTDIEAELLKIPPNERTVILKLTYREYIYHC